MEYKNYSISNGKGKLYLKSTEPKEGYEKITYGEGKTTFHQYADSVKGLPKTLEVKEILHEGKTLKFLELTLIDGEIANKVSVSLKNPKGNYSDETKVLLSALNSLELGEEVTLTTKSTTTTSKTNGKEYKNLNVYINYVNRLGDNGKGLSTGFISYHDIPKPIEKIVAGDKVYDWSPQTEFFYTKLGELITKFQVGGTTKTENKLPPQTPATATNVKVEDPSSLPF
jgi:hypothetical protein